MCGENSTLSLYASTKRGSPPRVRGKPRAPQKVVDIDRITPACAGKTASVCLSSAQSKDHPRVCGENLHLFYCGRQGVGSPPRVRGKHSLSAQKARASRITPACAGKTPEGYIYFLITQDHPRVCGENVIDKANELVTAGSPPRVRGKLSRQVAQLANMRITPACAGKTDWMKSPIGNSRDHPRVCGENSNVQRISSVGIGSPPRVRGKL